MMLVTSGSEYSPQSEKLKTYPNTRDDSDSSMISSLNPFLMQLNAMMDLGFTRPLQNGDLGTLPADALQSALIGKFNIAFENERKLDADKRSFFRILLYTLGWNRIVLGCFFLLISAGTSFSGPLLLKAISNHLIGIAPLQGGRTELWILIALVFIVPIVGSIFSNQSTLIFNYMGIQVRNVMTAVMYKKVISLRCSEVETGLVINMINVDSKAMETVFQTIRTVCVIPPLIIVTLALVYEEVGVSMFMGLAYIIIVLPISVYLFGLLGTMFRERMKVGDKRLKMENEIFTGIRVIKYNAWEDAFLDAVELVRDREQQLSRSVDYIINIHNIIYYNNNSLKLKLKN